MQGEIERAISAATGERDFELYGSGRTDAGVHALAQVAHLDISRRRCRPRRCAVASTTSSPPTSTSCAIEKVRHKFHARHDARGRSYVYQVARRRTAFAKPFVWWVKDDLDVATHAGRRGAASSASTTSGRSPTTTRSRSRRGAAWTALEIHEDGDLIVFRVEGSHFIWKMVRRLVGVIVEVGRGGLTADEAVGDAVVRFGVAGAVDRAGVRPLSRAVRYDGDRAGIRDDPYGLLLAGGVMPLQPQIDGELAVDVLAVGHREVDHAQPARGRAQERHRSDALGELLIVELLQHRGPVVVDLPKSGDNVGL